MKKKNKDYFYLGNNEHNILGSKIEENRYDYEEYVFDMNNKNDSHTAVARRIKEKSQVLDIGCASGLTGKLLKDFKKCVVDGIECDRTAIQIAKKRNCYRDLYHFSITDEDSKEYQKFFSENKKYDYIIFCDVLEHLNEPWKILVKIKQFLKKDGHILICLPNIAHIDIIRALINQEFNYNKLGLIDSTHIRFFTASSFVDMIKNIGNSSGVFYNVELYEQIIITPSYVDNSSIFCLLDTKKNLKNYLVLQNLFDLTLTNDKKEMKFKIPKLNHDFFAEIDQTLITLENDLKQEKKNNSDLKNLNEELHEEINKILNSKRWKFISKLADIKHLIFK